MSNDILDYPSNSRITAMLTHSPDETMIAGFILIRDLHNRVWRKIDLTRDHVGTWIDLTLDVVPLERGFVEVELVRMVGNGPWSATLHLRAAANDSMVEARGTEHCKHNHLDPSLLFRNAT